MKIILCFSIAFFRLLLCSALLFLSFHGSCYSFDGFLLNFTCSAPSCSQHSRPHPFCDACVYICIIFMQCTHTKTQTHTHADISAVFVSLSMYLCACILHGIWKITLQKRAQIKMDEIIFLMTCALYWQLECQPNSQNQPKPLNIRSSSSSSKWWTRWW